MRRRQSGQVLVLALLALLIAVGGTYAGVRTWQQMRTQRQAAQAADEAQAFFSNALALYANSDKQQSDVESVGLIAAGVVPPAMIQGSNLVSPWGTQVFAIAGYSPYFMMHEVVQLTYYQVPRAACAAFAARAAGFAAIVVVAGTAVQDTTMSRPLSQSFLATACASGSGPVQIQLATRAMGS